MTDTTTRQMLEAAALLPCPFCGSEAHLDDFGGSWWVECGSCHANAGHYHETAEVAQAFWNRRAAAAIGSAE